MEGTPYSNALWDDSSCNCTVQPEDSYPGDGINNDIEYGDYDGENKHAGESLVITGDHW